MWSVFKLAGRSAIWRTTADPPLVGLPSLIGWTLLLAAIRIGLQYLAGAGTPLHFNPYGLNAVAARLALELAIAALLVRPGARVTALAAMFVLSIIGHIGGALIQIGEGVLAAKMQLGAPWSPDILTGGGVAVEIIWWVGAMTALLASVQPANRLPSLARAAAIWVALFVAHALVPDAPVFLPPNFDVRNANWWEYLYARYSEQKELAAQGELLKAEVANLAPQREGATDIYVIGIAGWATQDVFIKELEGAIASMETVLPVKNHVVRLINNRTTIDKVPLANAQNFTAAVRAVGAVMDKNEDVLLIFMTSHGERTGFALQLPGAPPVELTPQQVAGALDSEGIKNRVVIVSACFAGIFMAPLQNDNTIVLTASDDKSTSFGCAPQREWTYFGDALFNQSLQPGKDFQQAFTHARMLIEGWEFLNRVPASHPQGWFGSALVARLAPVFQAGPNGE